MADNLIFFHYLKSFKKHLSYKIKGLHILNCKIIVAKLAVCATREADFLVAVMGAVREKHGVCKCMCVSMK